ncbi:hypothetical protein KIPB_003329 [Kipferlia bialata]|uniref:Uncharacterized protein n=1 Tax=Kipferlia bialata TaxID=797122 RepID=A0A9K3GH47_9EUKA|nr:hypothetical protein KIPB_003329 [Kipferlia bialata]|eukprot:g3329.t1
MDTKKTSRRRGRAQTERKTSVANAVPDSAVHPPEREREVHTPVLPKRPSRNEFVAMLKGQKAGLKAALKKAKKELAAAGQKIQNLTDQVTTLQGENSGLQSQLQEANREIDDLKGENTGLQSQLQEANREIDDLKSGDAPMPEDIYQTMQGVLASGVGEDLNTTLSLLEGESEGERPIEGGVPGEGHPAMDDMDTMGDPADEFPPSEIQASQADDLTLSPPPSQDDSLVLEYGDERDDEKEGEESFEAESKSISEPQTGEEQGEGEGEEEGEGEDEGLPMLEVLGQKRGSPEAAKGSPAKRLVPEGPPEPQAEVDLPTDVTFSEESEGERERQDPVEDPVEVVDLGLTDDSSESEILPVDVIFHPDKTKRAKCYLQRGSDMYHNGKASDKHCTSFYFDIPSDPTWNLEVELYPFEDSHLKNIMCLGIVPQSANFNVNNSNEIPGSVFFYQDSSVIKMKPGDDYKLSNGRDAKADDTRKWPLPCKVGVSVVPGRVDFSLDGRCVATKVTDEDESYVAVFSCIRPKGDPERVCRCIGSGTPVYSPTTKAYLRKGGKRWVEKQDDSEDESEGERERER